MSQSVIETGAATAQLRAARDFLLEHRDDYDAAYRGFRWPELERFNWALDWFDVLAAEGTTRPALWIVEEDGARAHAELRRALRALEPGREWLRDARRRARRPDPAHARQQVELWETMLAAMKLGAVIIPATTLLAPATCVDRVERGDARHVVVDAGDAPKFAGRSRRLHADRGRRAASPGWLPLPRRRRAPRPTSRPTGRPRPTIRCCSTSPRAPPPKPKLVEHTPRVAIPSGTCRRCTGSACGRATCTSTSPPPAGPSTPGARLRALDRRGDGARLQLPRFDAAALLETMARCGVTTFCAPPTVWRMLIQAGPRPLAAACARRSRAGEPLNPEVIEQVRRAWGITIRDGYGQTETTAQIGNTAGAAGEARLDGRAAARLRRRAAGPDHRSDCA